MELAIHAQQMGSLALGLVENHEIVKKSEALVLPEAYLKTIDEALRAWEASLDSLIGVVVVTGPGSFTASRVSTTIANTIGFSRGIPVTGVENPQSLSLEELLRSPQTAQIPAPFVLPTYNRPANITTPRSFVGINTVE